MNYGICNMFRIEGALRNSFAIGLQGALSVTGGHISVRIAYEYVDKIAQYDQTVRLGDCSQTQTYINLSAGNVECATVQCRRLCQALNGMLRSCVRRRMWPWNVSRYGAVIDNATFELLSATRQIENISIPTALR